MNNKQKTIINKQDKYRLSSSVFRLPRVTSGDTIIEVMLSIVLIGSAIALAVTMSNHNLNVGISTTQRTQALSITQGQIERIRNAYNTNNPILETYKSDQAYCILNDGSVEQVGAQDSKCLNFNDTQYSISITYDDTSKVFSATTSWVSNSSGSGQDQLKLSYKLPS
ncbi:TPA: hypothetical protein DIS56_02625 [Candidatus Saccharibacteria bacterium]|nr:MAG: hypothetical protein A3F05_03305 [Candidatus Saccharibacteria bacterium RIFCSPHIGHO2_12_FULL_47_17]HCM52005.1 hypothetical protein [Candidatus Saccharibacteria bacterium]